MKRTVCIIVLGMALALGGVACAGGLGSDTDKINGDVHLASGETGGDLSTVNGSIDVGSGAHADAVETVNGSIDMDANATANTLETVNGSITLGAGAKVARTIEAVNGSLHLDRDADVGGRVSNVNGKISLRAAHVGGGLETVAGDIDVGANSHVEGGILVDKVNGGWHWGKSHTPRIVIGPNAVVRGTLEFRRDVELYVSDRAQIGPIKGATAKKFSGEQP